MSGFGPQALLHATLEERYDHWIIRTAPVTQAAAEQDIVIEQGARFYLALKWLELRGETGSEEPVDLTGWSFKLRLAKDYGGETILDLDATLSEGLITWPLLPAATAALTGWTRGVYAVEGTNGTDVRRLVRGCATRALAPVVGS